MNGPISKEMAKKWIEKHLQTCCSAIVPIVLNLIDTNLRYFCRYYSTFIFFILFIQWLFFFLFYASHFPVWIWWVRILQLDHKTLFNLFFEYFQLTLSHSFTFVVEGNKSRHDDFIKTKKKSFILLRHESQCADNVHRHSFVLTQNAKQKQQRHQKRKEIIMKKVDAQNTNRKWSMESLKGTSTVYLYLRECLCVRTEKKNK